MSRHLYFLGIGGTLMGSLAILAKEAGFTVTGSDKAIYPPMSDLLAAAGIEVFEGFDASHLTPAPDLVVMGNAGLPRGHPGVEAVLERGLPFVSGAEWLGREILPGRWTIAVSGTHGKTTTASMIAWILEYAGLTPGYLIGGAPQNFERSARLGDAPFFVIEADEYDTSYFDRRSKFVHYRPRTLVINNLEFDHADIFDDLAAIESQFHLLLRSVPGNGLIIAPEADDAVNRVLRAGCWTPVSRLNPQLIEATKRGRIDTETGESWNVRDAAPDGSRFDVYLNDAGYGTVTWPLTGAHNVSNALAATAAARHAGVTPEVAVAALSEFKGVKRRMEKIAEIGRTRVYDDFAHHPTAIRTTLQGLRKSVGSEEVIAVIEPRTHTMSLGALRDELKTCCAPADRVCWFRGPKIRWDLLEVAAACVVPATVDDSLDGLIDRLVDAPKDKPRHIVIMSNGSFDDIYTRLPAALDGKD
ncbi:MAG: UDP-N-acetylmuramate:L-alanyl-gamma-D-glutamyl-meso-diaminopimelate ligase [Pseudomonadota bacterium]